jgi:hypothetical protein
VTLKPATASWRSSGPRAPMHTGADLEPEGSFFVHAPHVAFRAHRNYLHSTTLYKEVLAGAEARGLVADGPIELRVRRLIRSLPELRYSRSPIAPADDAPAVFWLQASGTVWHGAVVERELPIVERELYDESPISSRAVVDDAGIRVGGPSGMHPIEVITSLTLLLHQQRFTIGKGQKWYLARIELGRPLETSDADRIWVELVRRFGSTMTRSSISSGEERIGHLEFIAGRIG